LLKTAVRKERKGQNKYKHGDEGTIWEEKKRDSETDADECDIQLSQHI